MSAVLNKLFSYFGRRHFQEPGGYLEIWRIAYPLMIMSASHLIMQFTDRSFLAINSTEDVAAAFPAGILYFTLFSFFMVTTNFTSALVAQFFGARNNDACVRAAWTGFYFAVGAGLIIIYILPHFGRLILVHSGHAPGLITRELDYFSAMIPCGAFICMSEPFFAFFSGRGQTKFVAIVNIAACVVNLILAYMLIFGKFGAPALGIYGAGTATTLASMFSCVCAFTGFMCVNQKVFATRTNRAPEWAYIKKLLSYGTPAGLQVLFDVGAFTIVTFMIGQLQSAALAATTIALTINQFSFGPLLGFTDATSIVVGQNIGRDHKDIAEKSAYRAWRMAAFYMIFAAAVYLFLPTPLISLFSPKHAGGMIDFKEVLEIGKMILMFAAIFNFFDATKFVFMGALRGSGDTRAVLLICIISNWGLLVPGICILVMVFKCSIVTIWAYMTFTIMVEASILLWRFRTGQWRKIELIKRDSTEKSDNPILQMD
jgi:MATE family multidrug resistance protein